MPWYTELLYIGVGALFSATAAVAVNSYRRHKQANEARRAILEEMKSMETILNDIDKEHKDRRPIRTQIDTEITTKMYDQHMPTLGRLTREEIQPVISFYRNLNTIRESHLVYNTIREAETPESREERSRQKDRESLSSLNLEIASSKALEDLEAAKNRLEERSSWWGWIPGL